MSRAMKHSGIPWIGEIPESWDVSKVKDAFVRKNDKAHEDNPIVLTLARSGIKVRDISTNEGQMAESYYDYNPVEVDDLLINPMDLYSGANCSLSKVKGVISPAYINLRHKDNVCPRYYDYYFKTQYWAMAFFAHGKGISFDNRWTLGVDTLYNYYIPAPSYTEQQAIADFLDKKCAEIDQMVAIQEKFIEELKAYKQSLITETVTKGLNPNAKMKDSGVEWIGEIPEGWEIERIKNAAHLFGRIGFRGYKGDDLNKDGIGAITLSPSNMKEINMDYSNVTYLSWEKYYESPEIMIQNGDILFVKTGSSYGKACFVSSLPQEATINPQILRIVPYGIVNKYLCYILQSQGLKYQTECDVVGGTIPTISQEKINNFYIPLAVTSEDQQSIADFLDKKCSEIDQLIAIKQKKIEEYKDYKKSLIYEYVTGKKEING